MKLLYVKDTREYVEDGDRWIPIPGSGVSRNCDRCGRDHEVHAYVENEGRTMVVGTSCMKADSPELAKRIMSEHRRERRARGLQKELEALKVRAEAYEQARFEVVRMQRPTIVQKGETEGGGSIVYAMGDAQVYVQKNEGLTAEHKECLDRGWIDKRLMGRGFSYKDRTAGRYAREIERKLKKLGY